MIVPYRQTTCETCLPVCLLTISGVSFTQNDETTLLIEGITRIRDNYALGIVDYFSSKFVQNVQVIVDNKYYCGYLGSQLRNNRVKLQYQKITLSLLSSLPKPYIINVDHNLLGAYEHTPHFVAIISEQKNDFTLFNPWTGIISRKKKQTVFNAILSLKKYIKICPLVISI